MNIFFTSTKSERERNGQDKVSLEFWEGESKMEKERDGLSKKVET